MKSFNTFCKRWEKLEIINKIEMKFLNTNSLTESYCKSFQNIVTWNHLNKALNYRWGEAIFYFYTRLKWRWNEVKYALIASF